MSNEMRRALESEFARRGWLTKWDALCVEIGAVPYITNRALLHPAFQKDTHYVVVGDDSLALTVIPQVWMVSTDNGGSRTLVALKPTLLECVEVWRLPKGGILNATRPSYVKRFWSNPDLSRYDDHGLYEFANLKEGPLRQFIASLRTAKAAENKRSKPRHSGTTSLGMNFAQALQAGEANSPASRRVGAECFSGEGFDLFWNGAHTVFHPCFEGSSFPNSRDFLTRAIASFRQNPPSFAEDLAKSTHLACAIQTAARPNALSALARRIQRRGALLRDIGEGDSIRARQEDAFRRLNDMFESCCRRLMDEGFTGIAVSRFTLALEFAFRR